MDIKQQIINEIANGAKKSFYQDCIKKGHAFPITTDSSSYEFRANEMWLDPNQDNTYFTSGATATNEHTGKEYKFTGKELEFVGTEKDENRNKKIAHFISLIPANITGLQRETTIAWIWDSLEYVTDRQIKKMKPWRR